ncbi:hypothetical protein AVL56_05765 [Alteromonas stellipolaris]|uniref:hypothetical protein n=1 Tax=Alteromonas stellipolaris TaxID=233316 RepID=UPI000770432C|nr:hypothetical protein [Alteromonas stellipolaris]AMJ93859.1 hypothetical protein AVL56_05765 [Alteromonas stellipolaris]
MPVLLSTKHLHSVHWDSNAARLRYFRAKSLPISLALYFCEFMITVEAYFQEAEHALSGLFESLEYYSALAKKSIEPIHISDYPIGLDLLENDLVNSKEIEKNMGIYQSHQFSKHFVCGSILQFASKAIDLFSNQKEMNFEKSGLFSTFNDRTKLLLSKYSVGRTDKGIPIGLIIFAGRSQYNHIEDGGKLRKYNQIIFKILCEYKSGSYFYRDPCFDLSNNLYCYSSNIVGFLGWEKYSLFKKDMSDIFGI